MKERRPYTRKLMAEMTATLDHFFHSGQFNGLSRSVSSGSHATTMMVVETWLTMVRRPRLDSEGAFFLCVKRAFLDVNRVFCDAMKAYLTVIEELYGMNEARHRMLGAVFVMSVWGFCCSQ